MIFMATTIGRKVPWQLWILWIYGFERGMHRAAASTKQVLQRGYIFMDQVALKLTYTSRPSAKFR